MRSFNPIERLASILFTHGASSAQTGRYPIHLHADRLRDTVVLRRRGRGKACEPREPRQLPRMGNYVALIRGVGPTNPNLRNDKLGAVLESLGCTDVRPVLASGNLVFRSTARRSAPLESRIEAAFQTKLGVNSDVLVRAQDEIEAMVKADPFKGAEHGTAWYLTVTFRKDRKPPIFSKLVRAGMDGPAFMAELEQRHGKRITTRTWNTVTKILAKMQLASD